MSLFQAREWWGSRPDGQEETGQGNLVVCNIDNASNNSDKIVTASYSGVLRIYFPQQANYKIDDLMIEKNLDEPILQIAAGVFLSSSSKLALAILHPRRLVVYSVNAMKGQGAADTSYYELLKNYEHKLDRTSYNFCYGPFGGVQGKDFICVQSMDGQLQILEQETFAFSRYLNNFLVPGPLAYVRRSDSFVTMNAAMEMECYKYQVLSTSSAEKSDSKDAHGLNNSKKVQTDWSLNLGEHGVDMFVATFGKALPATQEDVLLLGENTLFTVKEQGSIRLQKRLDYNPSCCVCYDIDDGSGKQNLIVGNFQNALMVYKDTELVWAARVEHTPIAVAIGNFAGINGFVVTMTDSCQVVVSYMGTDPPMPGVNSMDAKELDYEAMDDEHRRLLKVIKQASSDQVVEPTDNLVLKAQVPDALCFDADHEPYTPEQEADCLKDEQGRYISVMVRLFVTFTGNEDLDNVSINLDLSDAFITSKKCLQLPSLRGGNRTPLVLNVRFRVSKKILPNTLAVDVMAAYTMPKGEPRTARAAFRLPLALAARVVAPLKNAQFMFTLDTNRAPPPLIELFADILTPAINASPDIKRTALNVMTVLCASGADVTILVSKKAGRYRMQSGCFEALALLSQELVLRLRAKFENDDSGEAFRLSFKELLPLHDYFLVIDRHHALRLKLSGFQDALEKYATQFRVIQKRLLVRFKDKNPAPLQQLDTLFSDTYEELITIGSGMEKCQAQLREAANQLSCGTELMLMLIKFKHDLDPDNARLLETFLSPRVQDHPGQGWEERVDACMTHLLRTGLAKSARDAATIAQPLAFPKDTFKLKRHIQIVCDRLSKGLRLVDKGAGAASKAGADAPPPFPGA